MIDRPYFPESDLETARLELKTDIQAVINQSRWAGLKAGMRILDVGCGPGITSSALSTAAQPGGMVVGIDRSEERVEYARSKYGDENIDFVSRNYFHDLSDLGEFDFIWVRFVLEFHYQESAQLVKHLAKFLKTGGILCLGDLDYNCMIHCGHDDRMEKTFQKLATCQMKNNNFDPFAGRRLYQYLFDIGMTEINADVQPHHLIYGQLSDFDQWHWWKKIELAGLFSGHTFEEYEGGYEEFSAEFKKFFTSARRFTYTPLILCRGVKPDGQ